MLDGSSWFQLIHLIKRIQYKIEKNPIISVNTKGVFTRNEI